MKIAIIGSGISGLGATYLLHHHHQVTLYEAEPRLGGHSRTLTVPTPEGIVAVDTGFIVFNHRNYPQLTKLFAHLGVETAPSNMSFGVTIDDGWLEYGTNRLHDIFAQWRNLVRPSFYGMLRDIRKFHREAKSYAKQYPKASLRNCLRDLGLGDWFVHYHLLAMGGAIWSTPLTQMLEFPAQSFIRFFDNHGLLSVTDQPQWHTVVGGSQQYVEKIAAPLAGNMRKGCAVLRIERTTKGIKVHDSRGESLEYDQALLACHSDQALSLIAQPTAAEQSVLGAIRYQPNVAVLHTDQRMMPKRRKAWASWVYRSVGRIDQEPRLSLSYWMNNLQPLKTSQPIFVTLNPQQEITPALVHDCHEFTHPVFDLPAIAAQVRVPEIQGVDGLWFCGAWQKYGFHEDGLASAVRVVKAMGIEPPW